MLSDHERQTLREIQRQLSDDDPDFERSFRDLDVSTPPAHHRLAYTAGIVVAALLAMVGLAAGSPLGATVFTVIAGLVWFAQLKTHRS